MKFSPILISALAAVLLACGPAQTTDSAAASAASATQEVSETERASILAALRMSADAQGQVENECGEKVTPSFLPADVGLGRTILFVMGGGPNMASCYGDGPGLTLIQSNGAGWREIYSSRGGYMSILATTHNGARDLAFAGPGFSHPTYYYDGASYAPSGEEIEDSAMADATVLP